MTLGCGYGILYESIGENTWKPHKICTEEGIKAIVFDEYFKVSAVAEYAGSEDSGQGNLFWYSRRKNRSSEFSNIFRTACDELKQESGDTHQTKGYVPTMGAGFSAMALIR